MSQNPNWKTNTLLIGGALGLVSGLAAAYLIIRNTDETSEPLKLTSGDGAKIGMGVVTLLKMITDTFKR